MMGRSGIDTGPWLRVDGEWEVRVAGHGDPAVRDGQLLHRQVYEDHGFLNDPQLFDDDGLLVDHWTPAAHHVALHRGECVVGHLRLIDRRRGDLQVEQLWPGLELPHGCWEVSANVVCPRNSRRFETAKRMYREAFYYAADRGCTHWAAIVERSQLRILTRLFGFPMTVVGPWKPYLGAPNAPGLMAMDETLALVESGDIDAWFARSW